jgi:hypothetical protein
MGCEFGFVGLGFFCFCFLFFEPSVHCSRRSSLP